MQKYSKRDLYNLFLVVHLFLNDVWTNFLWPFSFEKENVKQLKTNFEIILTKHKSILNFIDRSFYYGEYLAHIYLFASVVHIYAVRGSLRGFI